MSSLYNEIMDSDPEDFIPSDECPTMEELAETATWYENDMGTAASDWDFAISVDKLMMDSVEFWHETGLVEAVMDERPEWSKDQAECALTQYAGSDGLDLFVKNAEQNAEDAIEEAITLLDDHGLGDVAVRAVFDNIMAHVQPDEFAFDFIAENAAEFVQEDPEEFNPYNH